MATSEPRGSDPRPSGPRSPGPHTPLPARSISSQFNSPSAFRSEQEECIVYELGARHFSAGFAGESRPRCIVHFSPEDGRRVGDYRRYDASYTPWKRKRVKREEAWGREWELYRVDVQSAEQLGLVEDKLERAVRQAHIDFLQLDQKARKALLVVPSLLPTPVLETAVKVLFNCCPSTPTITLLTTPLLAAVAAGLRNALVVEVGWEETVMTAIGEYKEVAQRRSVRAGKMVTREMANLLDEEVRNLDQEGVEGDGAKGRAKEEVSFEYAEEVTQRMAWCRPRPSSISSTTAQHSGMLKLPLPHPTSDSNPNIHLPFTRLAYPASTLFTITTPASDDDHDQSIHTLAYRLLLSLPVDLRSQCIHRIILTGGLSSLPGLRQRFLQELADLIEKRSWDVVNNYGSATAWREGVLRERSLNIERLKPTRERETKPKRDVDLPTKRPPQELKSEPESNVDEHVPRGVDTLGTWAGVSLLASLRVKGVREIDRDDFLKHGFRDGPVV